LASEQSRADCETIAKLGLKSKVLTHVPCTLEHAKLAVSTGVQGVGLVYDNSQSRGSSQGEPVDVIDRQAVEVIQYVKSQGLETRFTLEEAFRTDLVDLLALARAVDEIGVDRLTIAGSATPRQVYDLIRSLRGVRPPPKAVHNSLDSYQENKPKVLTNNLQAVKCGIECHL
jgi:homocitrate synthase